MNGDNKMYIKSLNGLSNSGNDGSYYDDASEDVQINTTPKVGANSDDVAAGKYKGYQVIPCVMIAQLGGKGLALYTPASVSKGSLAYYYILSPVTSTLFKVYCLEDEFPELMTNHPVVKGDPLERRPNNNDFAGYEFNTDGRRSLVAGYQQNGYSVDQIQPSEAEWDYAINTRTAYMATLPAGGSKVAFLQINKFSNTRRVEFP